ncbi:outer membrane protein assembly factor BamB family protein [Paenibacillus nasutitermitis]|nr:PQQ-binding-like beta-propeller repeat protein [Paenibacillus nasutitermitis]
MFHPIKWLPGRVTVMLAAVTLSMLAGSAVYAHVDPHTSYVGNNLDTPVQVPAIKDYWAMAMDKPADDEAMSGGAVAAGENKLFLVQGGQLVAVQTRTGKKLWSFGSGIKTTVVYENGRVYAAANNGTLYAVDAANGKKLWTSSIPSKGVSQLYVNGGRLYALNGDIQAYRITDGSLLWRDDYKESLPGPLLFAGERVFAANIESGAYSYEVLHAFNLQNGKEAWNKMNKGFPIAVEGDTVIVQRQQTIIDKGMLTTLDTLGIETGKAIQSVEYNPEKIDLDKQEFYSPGSAWISGDQVYIAVGLKVYAYPRNEDPDKAAMQTYLSPSAGDVRYALGPYAGRLIFSDSQSVFGVKLVNKGPVFYNGGLSNPVARIDLIGGGMYVAQTDGRLVAIDLVKAQPVSQLLTYGRVFGPTFKADGMIVVQTKGKLLAFPEPASLK